MKQKLSLWSEVKNFFSMRGFLTEKSDLTKRISDGISFNGPYLWVLVFAILIASLGLNVNSTAVIIGAMLISPLMGPIIGMGYAVGTNDLELFKQSLKNYGVSTLISLLTATIYFILTPYHGAQSELLARTSPSLYDVMIALFGGAAGIVALSSRDRGNILPGVAIATALMPPLCTAGFGLANLSLNYFLGAFYLYFINTVFIALATYLGVRMLKIRRKESYEVTSYKKVRLYLSAIVLLTMIPASIMTVTIVHNSIFDSGVKSFINNEMNFNGTQIISQSIDKENKVLTLAAVGKEISDTEIEYARERMFRYGLDEYSLNLIQGSISDSILGSISSINATKNDLNATIKHQRAEISDLKQKLSRYTRLEPMTKQIVIELKSFYPQIQSLSISPTIESGIDTNDIFSYLTAQIITDSKSSLSVSDQSKITDYIKNRVSADSVVLIIR